MESVAVYVLCGYQMPDASCYAMEISLESDHEDRLSRFMRDSSVFGSSQKGVLDIPIVRGLSLFILL